MNGHDEPPLIERLLPQKEIHLLAGPTGAGKTRWLFQMLLEWQAGLPVLGHASNPVPWVYVAADRSQAAACRTLADMHIDPDLIPLIPAWDLQLTVPRIFDAVSERGAKLIVWEAFGSFCEGDSKPAVKAYLSAIHKVVRQEGFTIMGVMESPKMKPGQGYENPRQRISGVATWGHFTETIFLIEPANPEDPSDGKRDFFCCPRNGQGIVKEMHLMPPNGTVMMMPSSKFDFTK